PTPIASLPLLFVHGSVRPAWYASIRTNAGWERVGWVERSDTHPLDATERRASTWSLSQCEMPVSLRSRKRADAGRVERSDTHQPRARECDDGFRFAQPIQRRCRSGL